jgi:hypothetical protein
MEDREPDEEGEAVKLVHGEKKVKPLTRRCLLKSSGTSPLLTSKASIRDTPIQAQRTLTIPILLAVPHPALNPHGGPTSS